MMILNFLCAVARVSKFLVEIISLWSVEIKGIHHHGHGSEQLILILHLTLTLSKWKFKVSVLDERKTRKYYFHSKWSANDEVAQVIVATTLLSIPAKSIVRKKPQRND
jgi:hypothetical protein